MAAHNRKNMVHGVQIKFLIKKITMSNQIKSPVRYFRAESTEQIESLLKPVENFAASFGLQPFRIIVVENKISGSSNTKKQQESWQLVFAVRNEITKSDIDNFIGEIREAKKYSANSLISYRKVFENSINSKTESGSTWAERQAYKGLDILLASAVQISAEANIDNKVDSVLYDNEPALGKDGYRAILSVQIKLNKKDRQAISANYKTNTVPV